MKKRNSPAKMFMKGFFKSFFIIALLFFVGFGSYKVTMFYYELEGTPSNSKANELIKDIVSDATVDEISKNLIFSVDNERGEIRELVLEVVNTNTNNIDYITIPVDTKFTLSNEMYKRLNNTNQDIPQIIKMSDINQYFEGDYVYDYGVLIMEDLLQVDISYYTSMDEEYFRTIFVKDGEKEVFSEQWKNRIADITTEDEIKEVLKELYEEVSSNLSIRNKEKYIPTYIEVNPEYVYFYNLIGEQQNEGFAVDIQSSSEMISQIINNQDTYTEKQKENSLLPGQVVESSKGYKIQILNGSGITGLAAHYKNKLAGEGYDISGINNYNGSSLTNTKIIVETEGLGYDLATYFADPTVTIEDLDDGIDIQIILGTADDIN